VSATRRAARWAAARKAATSALTSKAALWIAAALATTVIPVVALFGLILFTDPGNQPCPTGAPTADDGSPTIIGPSSLTGEQLAAWYRHSNRPDPQPTVGYTIDQLANLYIAEADAETIRGDLAFVQTVLETGGFTNSDSAIYNFAGIGHYDNAASGFAYASAQEGIRAQMQLLKRFALGNDVPLANPPIGPNAGARATTWRQLAGTWATDPGYWTSISTLYQSALDLAGGAPIAGADISSCGPLGAGSGTVNPDGYALPVDHKWWDTNPSWFTKTHHDYPAADIPVPEGTPVYAVTTGTVLSVTASSSRCGNGVIIRGDDGTTWTYCHGIDGGVQVTAGSPVAAGDHIMNSGNTGNSTGPHLHVAVKINGTTSCPQPILEAIATNTPISFAITTSCTH
jgi:murein DD-endopeptidase MepM/ murein hydrolase activator NlpD